MKRPHLHLSDFQGYGQLAINAVVGITDLVEAMHHTILSLPMPLGKPGTKPTTGVHAAVYKGLEGSSALVYGTIRRITIAVGRGLNSTLEYFHPERDPVDSSSERTAMISIVNGVLGDHLHAHGNPLTLGMTFRQDGIPLELTRPALASAIASPSARILVLLHGHCMHEMQWRRNGHDHGQVLAAENDYTPMYLRYNTGRHISENGRCLAGLLEELIKNWPTPVQELCIVGYSMGGMVARSAFHYGKEAGHDWVPRVKKLFFVGTPQHGSMLEQAGNMVDKALELSPYSHALSRLGKIRSAGTTDLRHGNLIDEDWAGQDRFAHARDQRHISQLPKNVKCYAIAATIAKEPGEVWGQLVGDGLVPLKSALGKHRDKNRSLNMPAEQQRVFYGMSHLALLDSQAVCAQLQQWIKQPPPVMEQKK